MQERIFTSAIVPIVAPGKSDSLTYQNTPCLDLALNSHLLYFRSPFLIKIWRRRDFSRKLLRNLVRNPLKRMRVAYYAIKSECARVRRDLETTNLQIRWKSVENWWCWIIIFLIIGNFGPKMEEVVVNKLKICESCDICGSLSVILAFLHYICQLRLYFFNIVMVLGWDQGKVLWWYCNFAPYSNLRGAGAFPPPHTLLKTNC